MLALIVKKEWQEIYREGRLLWVALSIVLLMITVMLSSWHNYQQLAAQKHQMAESERQRWLNQGEKGPHAAAHYGVYAVKPDSPLSVLEPGLNAYQGNAVFLEAHKQNDILFRAAQDAIALQRFGELTPAFIVLSLVPLLVVLLGYPMIAGERDSGTLRQLLASGARPERLFAGKATALLLLSIAFLLPIALFLLISALSNAMLDWPRAVMLLLVYLIYILVWTLITLTVSVYAKTARLALIILSVLWVSMCLLLPKMTMEWSASTGTLTSAREFQSQMELLIYTPERLQAIENFKQQSLKAHDVTDVSELPYSWSGAQLQFSEEYSNAIFDQLHTQRRDELNRQTERYQWAGLVSPFVGLQMLSAAMASSDLLHHQWFAQAAEIHRRVMQKTLNNDLMEHGKSVKGRYAAGEHLWQKIPRFNYQHPGLATALPHYRSALFTLVLWLVLAFLGSALAIKRLNMEGQA